MSLNSPAVNALALEASVMKLLAEWLGKWFTGTAHVLGGHGSLRFPAATLRFQQSALPQPLTGAGITAVWVAAANTTTRWEAGQQVAFDHASWFFLVRAANDDLVCRTASDRLIALLRNPAGTKKLAEKGIHKLRPSPPQLISDGVAAPSGGNDPNYVTRLIACQARLRYPIFSQT